MGWIATRDCPAPTGLRFIVATVSQAWPLAGMYRPVRAAKQFHLKGHHHASGYQQRLNAASRPGSFTKARPGVRCVTEHSCIVSVTPGTS